jgi:hypothetical protein
MRDRYIALATEMADLVTKAKREHERAVVLQHIRPSAEGEPAAKRVGPASAPSATSTTTSTSALGRRFRVLKTWDSTKQQSAGEVAGDTTTKFISVIEDEIVTAVESEPDLDAPWIEVELVKGERTFRGFLKCKVTGGGPRLEEIKEAEKSAPAVAVPMDSDSDDADGEPRREGLSPRREPQQRTSENELTPGRGENDLGADGALPPAYYHLSELQALKWATHAASGLQVTPVPDADPGLCLSIWWDGNKVYKLSNGQPVLVIDDTAVV